jgi:hypothetical protein
MERKERPSGRHGNIRHSTNANARKKMRMDDMQLILS